MSVVPQPTHVLKTSVYAAYEEQALILVCRYLSEEKKSEMRQRKNLYTNIRCWPVAINKTSNQIEGCGTIYSESNCQLYRKRSVAEEAVSPQIVASVDLNEMQPQAFCVHFLCIHCCLSLHVLNS